MPRLIKNISGEIIEENISIVKGIKSIEGQVGLEDYAKVYNFTGYLQNFTKVSELSEMLKLKYFGVMANLNKEWIEIEVSY